MDEQLAKILVDEIKENRKAIVKVNEKLNTMDKHIFSNKFKLSMIIGGVSLFSTVIWAIILEKIKTAL